MPFVTDVHHYKNKASTVVIAFDVYEIVLPLAPELKCTATTDAFDATLIRQESIVKKYRDEADRVLFISSIVVHV